MDAKKEVVEWWTKSSKMVDSKPDEHHVSINEIAYDTVAVVVTSKSRVRASEDMS